MNKTSNEKKDLISDLTVVVNYFFITSIT